MYSVEETHWWYVGMQSITEALLTKHYDGQNNLKILDAGCGTGIAMTTYLARFGSVTGIDISSLALFYCQKRDAQKIIHGSVAELPFCSESFDLVTSFDVLYEDSVPDDSKPIKEFSRVLKNNGHVLLRLPAYNWLRGQHDEIVHTARRYTLRQLKLLLKGSGLQLEFASYANTFLFPFAALKRISERIFRTKEPVSDLEIPTKFLNKALKKILEFEAFAIPKIHLPFGLSVIALARKIENHIHE